MQLPAQERPTFHNWRGNCMSIRHEKSLQSIKQNVVRVALKISGKFLHSETDRFVAFDNNYTYRT